MNVIRRPLSWSVKLMPVLALLLIFTAPPHVSACKDIRQQVDTAQQAARNKLNEAIAAFRKLKLKRQELKQHIAELEKGDLFPYSGL